MLDRHSYIVCLLLLLIKMPFLEHKLPRPRIRGILLLVHSEPKTFDIVLRLSAAHPNVYQQVENLSYMGFSQKHFGYLDLWMIVNSRNSCEEQE